LRGREAIYLGTVGHSTLPDHLSLWDLFLPIRRQMQQHVNLRPVKLFRGVRSPLAGRKAQG